MRFAYSSDIYDNAFDYLGMLPIALGLGAGAELRQSMGVVLVGGLTTSTLLTLVVVPLLYLLSEEWKEKHCINHS